MVGREIDQATDTVNPRTSKMGINDSKFLIGFG